ncbi:unknown protein [Desulfotalea psychrophila LSv54]|uniref:Uncharacterized protein n=1 Tax=Desulfotalea psychrophila (strain LSv54 / DSM 12343) TaxID=177439 RepID=Q6AQV1_DESPS|nr:unknown protein [Desulfotalea psychrophila LSv54]
MNLFFLLSAPGLSSLAGRCCDVISDLTLPRLFFFAGWQDSSFLLFLFSFFLLLFLLFRK